MEEDIINYLPTVMFRGTPCSYNGALDVGTRCIFIKLFLNSENL